MIRKTLRFLLTRDRDPQDFRNQGIRVDRRGRLRGGSYEQATGETPPADVRQFGQTWDRRYRR